MNIFCCVVSSRTRARRAGRSQDSAQPSPTEVEVIEASLLDVNYTSCYAPRARAGERPNRCAMAYKFAPYLDMARASGEKSERRLRGAKAGVCGDRQCEKGRRTVEMREGAKNKNKGAKRRKKRQANTGTRQTACVRGGRDKGREKVGHVARAGGAAKSGTGLRAARPHNWTKQSVPHRGQQRSLGTFCLVISRGPARSPRGGTAHPLPRRRSDKSAAQYLQRGAMRSPLEGNSICLLSSRRRPVRGERRPPPAVRPASAPQRCCLRVRPVRIRVASSDG